MNLKLIVAILVIAAVPVFAQAQPLSFPKMISARTDDAARTEWAWRQWFRIAGPLAVAAHLCPATSAYAFHCNKKRTW